MSRFSSCRGIHWLWALAVCGALLGCSSRGDKAAKERIFSPEDPPKVVSSAKEKLPADKLSQSLEASKRVLEMGAAEATERLGSFKYGASVKFEWTDESSTLELSETRSLLASRGGVSGDFHATVQNSRDQGLEVIRVGGRVFARSRYGKFRERKRDRGMAEREREEVFGSLSDFSELFGHRVKLEGKGTTSVAGRKAYRYQASLANQRASEREEVLPARPEPKGGMDVSSKRRLAFVEQRVPNSLSGEILVDADTGVVLKAKLSGKIAVPPQANQKRAQLALSIDSSLSDIDKDREVAILVPKDYLPDEDKPRGIAVALEKFGVSSAPDSADKPAQPGEAAEPVDER